jgi:DNA topoisomerase-1
LIVDREREIHSFKFESAFKITAIFDIVDNQGKNIKLAADFQDRMTSEKEVEEFLKACSNATFFVSDVQKKPSKRTPTAPFTTSTLQQEASRKLGYSVSQTMSIAQRLYESGQITYMRTDSVNLSNTALDSIKKWVLQEFGEKYYQLRKYKSKIKGAQEAHEAIRPTNAEHTPESLKNLLTPQQYRLYNLIWKRTVATQMSDAKLDKTTIDIDAKKYTFRTNGQIIIFNGWLKLYPKQTKDDTLPDIEKNDKLHCEKLDSKQHFTEPPARYSDALLVKALEEHEIGRPSTYAPTIATIENRGYVIRNEDKRLAPTDVAFVVTDLLVKHFPQIVDLSFTAKMEDDLDKIAEGKKKWQPVIESFYGPFHKNLEKKTKEVSKKEVIEEKTKEKCEKCGKPMVIKLGRFGKFLACSNYPECKNTKPINPEEKQEQKEVQKMHEKCDKCGKPMTLKQGRFGAFLGCSGYPECKNIKSFENKTGVKCDKCDKGEIVEKRSKKGRIFYACNQYPACTNALWNKPTGKKCPECKALLGEMKNKTIKCSGCKYTKPAKK